jgi:hypothetical protein
MDTEDTEEDTIQEDITEVDTIEDMDILIEDTIEDITTDTIIPITNNYITKKMKQRK